MHAMFMGACFFKIIFISFMLRVLLLVLLSNSEIEIFFSLSAQFKLPPVPKIGRVIDLAVHQNHVYLVSDRYKLFQFNKNTGKLKQVSISALVPGLRDYVAAVDRGFDNLIRINTGHETIFIDSSLTVTRVFLKSLSAEPYFPISQDRLFIVGGQSYFTGKPSRFMISVVEEKSNKALFTFDSGSKALSIFRKTDFTIFENFIVLSPTISPSPFIYDIAENSMLPIKLPKPSIYKSPDTTSIEDFESIDMELKNKARTKLLNYGLTRLSNSFFLDKSHLLVQYHVMRDTRRYETGSEYTLQLVRITDKFKGNKIFELTVNTKESEKYPLMYPETPLFQDFYEGFIYKLKSSEPENLTSDANPTIQLWTLKK